jgi:hypothetical protein
MMTSMMLIICCESFRTRRMAEIMQSTRVHDNKRATSGSRHIRIRHITDTTRSKLSSVTKNTHSIIFSVGETQGT